MSAGEGFEEFVAIVDAGSVTGAARALEMPRPTVSRRLARLEARLGTRLIQRTTRRLTLTEAGERLYASARGWVHAAREAEAAVRRLDGIPRGHLRLSIPNAMPHALFAGWLGEFLERYPEVSLEVVATTEHVDLVGQGYDVALRSGEIEDRTLIARTLVRTRDLAFASPRYLDARGAPTTPEDLAHHECILGFRAGKVPERRWPLLEGGSVPVSGRAMTNDMRIRVAAARRALGIALVSQEPDAWAPGEGALVPVLPNQIGREARVSLVYADREYIEPKVRAFVDFLAERLPAARARRLAERATRGA